MYEKEIYTVCSKNLLLAVSCHALISPIEVPVSMRLTKRTAPFSCHVTTVNKEVRL